jgi:hypothetical protein
MSVNVTEYLFTMHVGRNTIWMKKDVHFVEKNTWALFSFGRKEVLVRGTLIFRCRSFLFQKSNLMNFKAIRSKDLVNYIPAIFLTVLLL